MADEHPPIQDIGRLRYEGLSLWFRGGDLRAWRAGLPPEYTRDQPGVHHGAAVFLFLIVVGLTWVASRALSSPQVFLLGWFGLWIVAGILPFASWAALVTGVRGPAARSCLALSVGYGAFSVLMFHILNTRCPNVFTAASGAGLLGWAAYVTDNVSDALLLGLPQIFHLKLSTIDSTGWVGSAATASLRLFSVNLAVQFGLAAWSRRGAERNEK